jgi:hypothetical protein
VALSSAAKIGYRGVPWQRRRGIGSEVVAIITRWAFAELGLARVQLEHAVANVGSWRVAGNAGFGLEGTLRSASQDGASWDGRAPADGSARRGGGTGNIRQPAQQPGKSGRLSPRNSANAVIRTWEWHVYMCAPCRAAEEAPD